MAISLFWLGAGFLIGVLGTGFALEFAHRSRNTPKTVLSRSWDTAELGPQAPRIMTNTLLKVPVPRGTRLLVPPGTGVPKKLLTTTNIRVHDKAAGNVAVGADSAIMFLGPPQKGTLAVNTIDPEIVGHLARAFDNLWADARPYVSDTTASQIHGQEGTTVELSGTVREVLRGNGAALVRVRTDSGEITARMDQALAPATGTAIRVRGTVRKGAQGTVVDANEVDRLAEAPA